MGSHSAGIMPQKSKCTLESVAAHPCAGGALKTSGGQASQALGRSRGGFSTKIHIAVDGLGNPLHFM